MSSRIYPYTASKTLYGVFLIGNQAWNTSSNALETPQAANWAQYAVALSAVFAGAPLYRLDFPAALAAGDVEVSLFLQAGGAASYAADSFIGGDQFYSAGSGALAIPNSGAVALTAAYDAAKTAAAPGAAMTLTAAYDAAKTAASQTSVNAITNNSRIVKVAGPAQMAIPASGTVAYEFDVICLDPATGALVDADAMPTVTARDAAGTSLAASLSAVSAIATGRYKFTFTCGSADSAREVLLDVSATVAGSASGDTFVASEAAAFSSSFTTADRATLNGLAGSTTPGWYSAPPSAATIATAVLTDTTDVAVANSVGAVNALVTSLLGRLTTTRAGLLDNLNVGGLVASHADVAGISGGSSLTTAQVASAVWDEAGSAHTVSGSFGARLDAAISGRLAAADYVAPDNADIASALADLTTLLGRTDPSTALAAIKGVTDHLATGLEADGAGAYRFTSAALVNAPTGSGGGGSGGTFTLPGGSVSASPAATTATFTATGTGLVGGTGGYAGQQVRFSSGPLVGQRFAIAQHVVSGSDHAFTVAAMPQPPAAGNTFDIL